MVQILLATYNGEKYVEEQIASLLKQTYKDIQVLIRDDGSTDQTINIIKGLCTQYPQQLILIEDDCRCGSAKSNFMQLLKYASADYVMFCDQDDVWFEDKVRFTLEVMKKEENKRQNSPVLIYSDYQVMTSELLPLNINVKSNQIYNEKLDINHLLVQNYVTGCTMMVNKSLYNNTLVYREELLMHDWWLAIYAATFGVVKHIPKTLMYYRQHENNYVGAVNVRSVSYIWAKIKDKSIRESNDLYYKQAKAFYEQYAEQMDEKSRKIFETFLNIPNSVKVIRIIKLVKGQYLKNTFIRVLGQFWYI